MNTLLSLGIAMAVGLLFTRIVKLVKLPNVTGYLIAGLLIGPSVLGLIDKATVESFNMIVTLALGFIAFSIGGEFKLGTLKKLGKNVTVITFFQAIGAVAVVFVVLLVAGLCGALGEDYLPMVFTLSAIATATAPAATLLVVRQYKAHGPVTETLLPVVAMDDAIGLMIFAIFNAIAVAIASGETPTVTTMLLDPLLEIVLSLLIGFALGLIVALCTRVFKSRANRLCLCITATVIGVALADMWGLSSLLLCMMIGAVFSNLGFEVDRVLEGTDRWTPPLFMLFFVISGADLDLSILPTVGILGALYIIARALGKYFGAMAGSAVVKADPNVRKYLGITLLPQAGVAVGMAQIALSEFTALGESDIGRKIQAVVLCATLVYEIVGPVLTKISLKKAGEITGNT
ncbi:MAG: cation:proton antiporter [Clostridiales bacterium]|nr:cation:proton antiporter [Clostridiales bacterium]